MGAIKRFFRYGCLLLALSSAAVAQTPPAKQGGVKNQMADKYDTKLPVEISSDNLEVLQHENKAIFKGNVVAVQGKIRLKADTMIVHYKQKTDAPGTQGAQAVPVAQPAPPPPTPGGKAPASATSDQGTMGAITLIEVEGNVFAATPEESAKGDKGDYQVAEKLLHLTGDNVTLTRDKNILRGTERVYNLETGRSVLTNNGSKVGGSNGGRVHGVFVPNEDDKAKNKTKDKGKKPDAVPAGTPAATSVPPVTPAPVPAGN